MGRKIGNKDIRAKMETATNLCRLLAYSVDDDGESRLYAAILFQAIKDLSGYCSKLDYNTAISFFREDAYIGYAIAAGLNPVWVNELVNEYILNEGVINGETNRPISAHNQVRIERKTQCEALC